MASNGNFPTHKEYVMSSLGFITVADANAVRIVGSGRSVLKHRLLVNVADFLAYDIRIHKADRRSIFHVTTAEEYAVHILVEMDRKRIGGMSCQLFIYCFRLMSRPSFLQRIPLLDLSQSRARNARSFARCCHIDTLRLSVG